MKAKQFYESYWVRNLKNLYSKSKYMFYIPCFLLLETLYIVFISRILNNTKISKYLGEYC